jgi:hypothetical protein
MGQTLSLLRRTEVNPVIDKRGWGEPCHYATCGLILACHTRPSYMIAIPAISLGIPQVDSFIPLKGVALFRKALNSASN